jgi:hypothetical protein
LASATNCGAFLDQFLQMMAVPLQFLFRCLGPVMSRAMPSTPSTWPASSYMGVLMVCSNSRWPSLANAHLLLVHGRLAGGDGGPVLARKKSAASRGRKS